jgi:hypothetical protein
MLIACMINNLEIKISEHRNPFSLTFICAKNNGKPLKGFVVDP